MRFGKKLKLSVIATVSLMSLSTWAEDRKKELDFDPSTLIPGGETTVIPSVTKWTVRKAREANGGDPGSEAVVYRRFGSAVVGVLATDAALRGHQILNNVEMNSDSKLFDHYQNVAAGGLVGLGLTEYAAANAKHPTGSRLMGMVSLQGAAYLGAKSDRKCHELAMGHAATATTAEGIVHSYKARNVPHGEIFSPRMGALMSGIVAATLYSDVYFAKDRTTGEVRDSECLVSSTLAGKAPADSGYMSSLVGESKGSGGKAN
jgi:hypothetical protein